MPVSSSIIFRHGGLRLIRQYLLIPIIIWIAYFVNLVLPILNENICSGVIFISGILILGFLLIRNLLFRMHKNRKREVDYVLLSMIALPNIKNDYTNES
jgi:hypothetical protein